MQSVLRNFKLSKFFAYLKISFKNYLQKIKEKAINISIVCRRFLCVCVCVYVSAFFKQILKLLFKIKIKLW